MTDSSAAAGRIKAYIDARDRFAASACAQGVEVPAERLGNIAQQPDTAFAQRWPWGHEAAARPGSASYPLNADDICAVLAENETMRGRLEAATGQLVVLDGMADCIADIGHPIVAETLRKGIASVRRRLVGTWQPADAEEG